MEQALLKTKVESSPLPSTISAFFVSARFINTNDWQRLRCLTPFR